MREDPEEPIFLIGEGRSGTTIFFETLLKHENVAYISNYVEKFGLPHAGFIHNFFLRQGQKPQYLNKLSIGYLINKILPKPREAYDTWEKLCGKKFRNTFMKDQKASRSEIERVKEFIEKIKKYQRRNRFAAKLTGPPRISYLASIFKRACFVNIVRDPRAVVASLLNVDFWLAKGNKPYWENTFSQGEYQIWENYNKTPAALAALEWNSVYEQTKKEQSSTDCRFYQVKYEDFVKEPRQTVGNILDFLNLKFSDNIIKHIERETFTNMNFKYKDRLTGKQIRVIEEICGTHMKQLNYI